MSEPKTDAPVRDASTSDSIAETIKQYNRAVRLAKLTSIVLEKVEFKISPQILSVPRGDLKREINVETEILNYEANAGVCIGNIIWSISIRYKRKRLAKCIASYIALYEIKDCSKDVVQMFIDNVGKTATYAYFRALFAQLDWAATLGSPPLPLIQFQPKVTRPKAEPLRPENKKLTT